MRKGIAIRTILLFLIGLITVGIIIYYVYRTFTGSTINREECRAMAISWCTGCWNAMKSKGSTCDLWTDAGTECDVGPDPSENLEKCATDFYQYTLTGETNCEGHKDFCMSFIPM